MTPVEVVNIALAEIGAQESVQSINPSDGSSTADIASLLYQPKIDSLSRAAHWNCLRYQQELTLIRATIIDGEQSDDPPPKPWLYEYLYPDDCLKARFIIPYIETIGVSPPLTTAFNQAPVLLPQAAVPYAIATDMYLGQRRKVILSNAAQPIMVYTSRVTDCNLWDPHFLNAATSFLGAWLVNALSRNRELMQDQINIAKDIIAQARISDGNEGITSVDHLPDWMAVRGFSGDFLNGSYIYQSYDLIAFPGGFNF